MHVNGVYHEEDERIDSLYAWMPPPPPAAPACPEALFSLTLKGKLDGIETLLTVRGMTAAEFQRNLASVKGLLDQPQAPSPAGSPEPEAALSPQQTGWCAVHGMTMKHQTGKDGRSWWSHWTPEGWCKGK